MNEIKLGQRIVKCIYIFIIVTVFPIFLYESIRKAFIQGIKVFIKEIKEYFKFLKEGYQTSTEKFVDLFKTKGKDNEDN